MPEFGSAFAAKIREKRVRQRYRMALSSGVGLATLATAAAAVRWPWSSPPSRASSRSSVAVISQAKTPKVGGPAPSDDGRRGFGSKSPPGGVRSKGAAEITWRCAPGCGACCKLDKGPAYPSPEEIFDDPSHLELYKSLIGPDGWCIHYESTTRTCSIYQDRPFFCRVEPEVLRDLYGIDERRFDREACRSCRDSIKDIYGPNSEELRSFNRNLRKQVKNFEVPQA